MLLAHLPRLLQLQPSAGENLATRHEHVRNNTSSSNSNSIMSRRKGSIERQRLDGDGSRNRLGSCHEHEHETDMDVGHGQHRNGNGLSEPYYPTSGFLGVNGPNSTATFGIDSPRKKRFT
jgi:hypothetical protein